MFSIFETYEYQKLKKDFLFIHKDLQKKYDKTITFLSTNPFHPSLRIHKINVKNHQNIYSISVDMQYRILIEWDRENNPLEIILHDIGDHKKVY